MPKPDPLAALDGLLRQAAFVHLTRIVDDDAEADDPARSRLFLSCQVGGARQTASAATLPELLNALSASAPRKRCSRCHESKPLTAFPRAPVRKDRPDGRHSHCKLCDRERKRGKYLRSQRRKAAPETAPAPGGGRGHA